MRYYDILGKNPEKHGFSHFPMECIVSEYKPSSKPKDNAVLIARGGALHINRAIVRAHYDVLLDPVSYRAMEVDSAVLRIAKERDITIGISLHQFLVVKGIKRVKLFHHYMKLIRLCNKVGSRILLTTNASDEMEQRQPIHLISLGVVLGMTKQQAKWSISMVPEYLMRRKLQ